MASLTLAGRFRPVDRLLPAERFPPAERLPRDRPGSDSVARSAPGAGSVRSPRASRPACSLSTAACGPLCAPLWPRLRRCWPSAPPRSSWPLPSRLTRSRVPLSCRPLPRLRVSGQALSSPPVSGQMGSGPAVSGQAVSARPASGGALCRPDVCLGLLRPAPREASRPSGCASGRAGAVQVPVDRPSPTACHVCVDVTSAAGSLTARTE